MARPSLSLLGLTRWGPRGHRLLAKRGLGGSRQGASGDVGWTPDTAIGDELELDSEALETCIGAGRYAEFVQQDLDAGRAAGVTGTPAFFINGIALKGARDADALSQVVDSELARVKTN